MSQKKKAKPDLPPVTKNALLSSCQLYRYQLIRVWDRSLELAVFIMLNPSVADSVIDDRTILKCMGFARRYGAGGILVLNLFAYRSTDPATLELVRDPIGPENDQHILKTCQNAREVIVAWGGSVPKNLADRPNKVLAMLERNGMVLKCLGVTDSGAPRHPLFIKGDTDLIPYPSEASNGPSRLSSEGKAGRSGQRNRRAPE